MEAMDVDDRGSKYQVVHQQPTIDFRKVDC